MLWQTGAAQEYFRSLEENGNLSDNNDDDESDNEQILCLHNPTQCID